MPPRYLDQRVKWIWFAPTLVALLIIWLIASLFAFIGMGSDEFVFGMSKPAFTFALFLFLFIFFGVPAYIYNHIEYVSFTFELSEREFIIRQGVLTRNTTVIPYNRIQNINTQRTLLERALGLASLQIETAGTNPNASEGFLPGVSNKDALVNEIMARVERVKKGISNEESNSAKTERELLADMLKELSQINHNLQQLASPGASIPHVPLKRASWKHISPDHTGLSDKK
ncbi:MAG: PH domain-containing protein [Candidatus Micrarchaeia archaeon]